MPPSCARVSSAASGAAAHNIVHSCIWSTRSSLIDHINSTSSRPKSPGSPLLAFLLTSTSADKCQAMVVRVRSWLRFCGGKGMAALLHKNNARHRCVKGVNFSPSDTRLAFVLPSVQSREWSCTGPCPREAACHADQNACTLHTRLLVLWSSPCLLAHKGRKDFPSGAGSATPSRWNFWSRTPGDEHASCEAQWRVSEEIKSYCASIHVLALFLRERKTCTAVHEKPYCLHLCKHDPELQWSQQATSMPVTAVYPVNAEIGDQSNNFTRTACHVSTVTARDPSQIPLD